MLFIKFSPTKKHFIKKFLKSRKKVFTYTLKYVIINYFPAPATTLAYLNTLLSNIYHFSNSSMIIFSSFQGKTVTTSCLSGFTSFQIEIKDFTHSFSKSFNNLSSVEVIHS
ncbi:MAG: hypothetical protein LBD88_00415 [Candidatus Peribacteria bacterium]|nr:hypothetical protein [Candidatus Peribacteria bacterium]